MRFEKSTIPDLETPLVKEKDNDYNLNIARYVSTAKPESVIDLKETHKAIVAADKEIREMTAKHNEYLKQLGMPPLP